MLPRRVYGWIGDIATTAAFSRLHAGLYRAFRGRGVGHALGCEIVLLETRGRHTGRPHEVPLFAFRDGARLFVIASRGGNAKHPAWYLNLRADPNAVVRLGGARRTVRARVAGGPEHLRLWAIASRAYPGYEMYRERTDRAIPVIVLEDA